MNKTPLGHYLQVMNSTHLSYAVFTKKGCCSTVCVKAPSFAPWMMGMDSRNIASLTRRGLTFKWVDAPPAEVCETEGKDPIAKPPEP